MATNITLTEIGYLDGVTSNIQTQINNLGSGTITEDSNAADFEITGTSFTATGLEVSVTTIANERPELKFVGTMNAISGSQAYCIFGYQIDADTEVGVLAVNTSASGDGVNASFSLRLPAMTAATHTVKIVAKEVSGGATNGNLFGTGAGVLCSLQIIQFA